MTDLKNKIRNAKGPALFSMGQAGFIIKSSLGQLLATDLYLSDCVERLEGNKGFKRLLPKILEPDELAFDVIICTHPHWDHFDVDAVPVMMSKGGRLFCSVDCDKYVSQLNMECYDECITYVRPGDNHAVGDFDIDFVSCDHGTGAPDAVGVVVRVDDKVIYEVGDSCLRLDRINEIPRPIDVLISPINGMYGNMDSDDTVKLAEALKPRLVIPCHYGMFASHGGDLKRFYDLMSGRRLDMLIMCQGEEYDL